MMYWPPCPAAKPTWKPPSPAGATRGYQAVTQQLHLLLTRYLRSEEKRPLMLSPFVGERALSSILIGAFSAEASPKPVWHLLRFVTNNDAQENFIGNVRTVSRRCLFWSCAQCSTRHGFPVRLLPGRCPVC